jgi:hypothetical protein
MQKDIRFVGLDVHKETIAIGVAEPSGGEVRADPLSFLPVLCLPVDLSEAPDDSRDL